MVDKRSRRDKAIAESRIQGAHRTLVRIDPTALADINAELPEGIRIISNGKYQARVRGADKREVTKTFTTLQQAKDWRARVQTQVTAGDWHDPRAGRATIGEFWPTYRASKANLKASSLEDIEHLWYRHVSDWEHIPVGSITQADVEEWVVRKSSEYSKSTVRKAVDQLRRLISLAVKAGAIPRDPTDLEELKRLYPRESTHEPNPLTQEQLALLLKHSSPRFRDLTEVLARTGMRIGEARELRVRDVLVQGTSPSGQDYRKHPMVAIRAASRPVITRNPDTGEVVRDTEGRGVYLDVIDVPKSGLRVIPLTPLAAAAFKRAIKGKKPGDLVFTNSRGDKVDRRGFNTTLEDAVARAGIVTESGRKITPHNLRDTFATNAVASGVPTHVLQAAIGHSTPQMTLTRYVTARQADLEAMQGTLSKSESKPK